MEQVLLKLRVGHESELLDNSSPHQTHRWTVYVRASDGTKLDSRLLQKVVFLLHPDFVHPNRVLKSPPFQVTETGYAGFSIPIALTFNGSEQIYNINYNMNLTMEKNSHYHVQQILEFRDSKPSLREQLLRFGACLQQSGGSTLKSATSAAILKKPSKPTSTPSFANLFGSPISVQPSTVENKKLLPSTQKAPKDESFSDRNRKNGYSKISKKKRWNSDHGDRDSASQSQTKKHSVAECRKRPASNSNSDNNINCHESPSHSLAPLHPQASSMHSATHSRPRPDSSLCVTLPLDGTDNRPIDTKLLLQLAHDFGANDGDAQALAAESARKNANTPAQLSPIYTADSSPDRPTPKRTAVMVASKGRAISMQASLRHLTTLQRRLMTLYDASSVLKVARVLRDEHVDVTHLHDGTCVEFDLCSLSPSVVHRLMQLCDLDDNGTNNVNGSPALLEHQWI